MLHEPIIESLLKNLDLMFPKDSYIDDHDNNDRILHKAIRHDERNKIKLHIREWYDSQMKLK